jgi:NADH-quinone oxidoreductase subunit N
MTLLSFAVLVIVAQQTGEEIADFDGLAKRSPFLAFAMLIGMVSLAGVPFTAGFLGKFFIFNAAIAQGRSLIVVGVITVAAVLLSDRRAMTGIRRQTKFPSAAIMCRNRRLIVDDRLGDLSDLRCLKR